MDAAHLKQSLMTLHWSTMTPADILRCPTDMVMGWYYGYDRFRLPSESGLSGWLRRMTTRQNPWTNSDAGNH